MAKRTFFIEIAGDINDRELWGFIEKFNVNLTSVPHKTWVYGQAYFYDVLEIISCSALFGNPKIEIGGEVSEQKEETQEKMP